MTMEIDIDYELIGTRIKKLRGYLLMTQEGLAKLTGFSKAHISNVENAHNIPSLAIIIKIALAMETTPDEFLLGLQREKDSDYLDTVVERMRLCTKRDQEIMGSIVDLFVEKKEK